MPGRGAGPPHAPATQHRHTTVLAHVVAWLATTPDNPLPPSPGCAPAAASNVSKMARRAAPARCRPPRGVAGRCQQSCFADRLSTKSSLAPGCHDREASPIPGLAPALRAPMHPSGSGQYIACGRSKWASRDGAKRARERDCGPMPPCCSVAGSHMPTRPMRSNSMANCEMHCSSEPGAHTRFPAAPRILRAAAARAGPAPSGQEGPAALVRAFCTGDLGCVMRHPRAARARRPAGCGALFLATKTLWRQGRTMPPAPWYAGACQLCRECTDVR